MFFRFLLFSMFLMLLMFLLLEFFPYSIQLSTKRSKDNSCTVFLFLNNKEVQEVKLCDSVAITLK